MARFKIQGASKQTGKDVELIFEANDYLEAQHEANGLGIAVSAIHPVSESTTEAEPELLAREESESPDHDTAPIPGSLMQMEYRVTGTSKVDKSFVDTTIVANSRDDAISKASELHIQIVSIERMTKLGSEKRTELPRHNPPMKKELDSSDKLYRLVAMLVLISCVSAGLIIFLFFVTNK